MPKRSVIAKNTFQHMFRTDRRVFTEKSATQESYRTRVRDSVMAVNSVLTERHFSETKRIKNSLKDVGYTTVTTESRGIYRRYSSKQSSVRRSRFKTRQNLWTSLPS